jgi:hypothetical protein
MNIFLGFVLGYYITGIVGYTYIYKRHKLNDELDVFGDNDSDNEESEILIEV